MAPPMARAHTAVPFGDVAHLKSLSLLRMPSLTRTHNAKAALEASNGFRLSSKRNSSKLASSTPNLAKHEELRELQTRLAESMSEEQSAQKQLEGFAEVIDFHRTRAKLAEQGIAKIESGTDDFPRRSQSHSGVLEPSSDKSAQGLVAINRTPASSSSAPVIGNAVNKTRPARKRPGALGSQSVMLPELQAQAPQANASAASASSALTESSRGSASSALSTSDAGDSFGEIAELPSLSPNGFFQGNLIGASTFTNGFGASRSRADMARSNQCAHSPGHDEEDRRRAIRHHILREVHGDPQQGFRALDLNGSGHVSFLEFSDALERLGIPFRDLTGLRKPQEVFRLFDLNKNGVLTREELFPEKATSKTFGHRASTPDFWSQYCRGTRNVCKTTNTRKLRCPSWKDNGSEEQLKTMSDADQAQKNVSEKRRWIAETMRRLKNQGRSDGRCREVCASHLPKGTGPKDRDDVRTFSDFEVKSVRKEYMEKVDTPACSIQKNLYEMRLQRKDLHITRQKLWDLTQRQSTIEAHEPLHAVLGGMFARRRSVCLPPIPFDDAE